MNWTKTKRNTLGALALAAGTIGAVGAAPLFALAPAGEPEWTGSDETTIKLRLDKGEPIVLKLDDMKVGDVRSFRENGKDVTASRDDKGFLVKVDGKEIRVMADPGEAGPGAIVVVKGKGDGEAKSFVFHSVDTDDKTGADGKTMRRVVVHGGHPGVFAFSGCDAKSASGKELLEKNEIEALRGADARTRDAVAKAIDELMAKGLVMAPGSLSVLHAGDGAQVTVERKKSETR